MFAESNTIFMQSQIPSVCTCKWDLYTESNGEKGRGWLSVCHPILILGGWWPVLRFSLCNPWKRWVFIEGGLTVDKHHFHCTQRVQACKYHVFCPGQLPVRPALTSNCQGEFCDFNVQGFYKISPLSEKVGRTIPGPWDSDLRVRWKWFVNQLQGRHQA